MSTFKQFSLTDEPRDGEKHDRRSCEGSHANRDVGLCGEARGLPEAGEEDNGAIGHRTENGEHHAADEALDRRKLLVTTEGGGGERRGAGGGGGEGEGEREIQAKRAMQKLEVEATYDRDRLLEREHGIYTYQWKSTERRHYRQARVGNKLAAVIKRVWYNEDRFGGGGGGGDGRSICNWQGFN